MSNVLSVMDNNIYYTKLDNSIVDVSNSTSASKTNEIMAKEKLTEEEMELVLGALLSNVPMDFLVAMSKRYKIGWTFYRDNLKDIVIGKLFKETKTKNVYTKRT